MEPTMTGHELLILCNISGFLFYKHLCITSRPSALRCDRVGETTRLWGYLITTYTKISRSPCHRIQSSSYMYISHKNYEHVDETWPTEIKLRLAERGKDTMPVQFWQQRWKYQFSTRKEHIIVTLSALYFGDQLSELIIKKLRWWRWKPSQIFWDCIVKLIQTHSPTRLLPPGLWVAEWWSAQNVMKDPTIQMVGVLTKTLKWLIYIC